MCTGTNTEYMGCGHGEAKFVSVCGKKCSSPSGRTTYLDGPCAECDPENSPSARKARARAAELKTQLMGENHEENVEQLRTRAAELQMSMHQNIRAAQGILYGRASDDSSPGGGGAKIRTTAGHAWDAKGKAPWEVDSDSESDDGRSDVSYLTEDGKHVVQKQYKKINGHWALLSYRKEVHEVDPVVVMQLREKRDKALLKKAVKAKLKAEKKAARKSEREAKDARERDTAARGIGSSSRGRSPPKPASSPSSISNSKARLPKRSISSSSSQGSGNENSQKHGTGTRRSSERISSGSKGAESNNPLGGPNRGLLSPTPVPMRIPSPKARLPSGTNPDNNPQNNKYYVSNPLPIKYSQVQRPMSDENREYLLQVERDLAHVRANPHLYSSGLEIKARHPLADSPPTRLSEEEKDALRMNWKGGASLAALNALSAVTAQKQKYGRNEHDADIIPPVQAESSAAPARRALRRMKKGTWVERFAEDITCDDPADATDSSDSSSSTVRGAPLGQSSGTGRANGSYRNRMKPKESVEELDIWQQISDDDDKGRIYETSR